MADAIDWDSFGHCCLCHKNMAFKQVVGMKEVQRFSPEYCEAEFMLNDNSKMKVALCQPCKDSITEKDYPRIEDSVIRGWEQEITQLGWSEPRKKEYMDRYSQIKIVCDSEDKHNDHLKEKMQVYKTNINIEKLKEAKNGISK